MKRNAITILFFSLILFGMLSFVFSNKETVSKTERRKLQSLPKFSYSELKKGRLQSDLETYLQDHFFQRDMLKNLHFNFYTKVLGKQSVSSYFVQDDYVSQILYNVEQQKFLASADFYEKLNNKYFSVAQNHYYSVIPDKNQYLLKDDVPKVDLNHDLDGYRNKMNQFAKPIDLYEHLSLENYYYGDIHWKQESLEKISALILAQQNKNPSALAYQPENLGRFSGSYASAIASKHYQDDLIIQNHAYFSHVTVRDLSTHKTIPLYDIQAMDSLDPYNTYLGGPKALLSLEHEDFDVEKDETLYIIRDSFASSITPYFIPAYKRIILIDSRYIDSKLLDRFISVSAQDSVYYLNSVVILAKPELLK